MCPAQKPRGWSRLSSSLEGGMVGRPWGVLLPASAGLGVTQRLLCWAGVGATQCSAAHRKAHRKYHITQVASS
jgi:hypothetical protein